MIRTCVDPAQVFSLRDAYLGNRAAGLLPGPQGGLVELAPLGLRVTAGQHVKDPVVSTQIRSSAKGMTNGSTAP